METYKQVVAGNPSVELIHMSCDQAESDALEWAKKEGFPWPTVLPDKQERTGLKEFASGAVPHYVLITKDGEKVVEGKEAVFAKVKELAGKDV